MVLKRVPNEFPLSGYVAPAMYNIGTHADVDKLAAVESLTRLAEGEYNLKWRGLAWWRLAGHYRPTDKVKAKDCYTNSVAMLRRCLAEMKADIGMDWRHALEQKISIIESEIRDLDAAGQGVN